MHNGRYSKATYHYREGQSYDVDGPQRAETREDC